jgi:CMP-2-keto-3-deoxyoctulosonic acid synthetase
MSNTVTMTVHFLDGKAMSFDYPRQSGTDQAAIVATVKKAIEADRLVIEVDGDLLVIPVRSVKYVRLSPAPPHLPAGVLRKAKQYA